MKIGNFFLASIFLQSFLIVCAEEKTEVFFPPEILVKKIPKIEMGQTLNIELIIRANPFYEEKEGKPITDEVR